MKKKSFHQFYIDHFNPAERGTILHPNWEEIDRYITEAQAYLEGRRLRRKLRIKKAYDRHKCEKAVQRLFHFEHSYKYYGTLSDKKLIY